MTVNGTNLSMTRGDSESITVSCTDGDGEAIDFEVGDIIYLTVKSRTATADIGFQKVITVFEGGKAVINIDPIDTKSLKFIDYVYDVQWTTSTGTVTTIVKPSTFTIEGEVTYD